jgi:antitoxin HicB
MRQHRYMILLHPDREQVGYWVTVPALPGCITQGDTMEQAIAMAREAIELHLEGLIEAGEPVPEDDDGVQAVTIFVAA